MPPFQSAPKGITGDAVLGATGSPLLATAAHSLQPSNVLQGLGDFGRAAGDAAMRGTVNAGAPPWSAPIATTRSDMLT